MYRSVFVVFLLCLQVYMVHHFGHLGPFLHPVALLVISLAVPACYLFLLLNNKKAKNISTKYGSGFAGAVIGSAGILACFFLFRAAIIAVPDPADYSDVLPQLTSQYYAFSKGQFPYFPLQQIGWHPYPVYMPLHWLPIGLAGLIGQDVRWVGFLFILLACGIWGYFAGKYSAHFFKKITAILLPALVFALSICLSKGDYVRTFETVIAAYYLLLAIGLSQKNLAITVAGIICCLLSRYTLVFWMPLFFIILWFNTSLKNNLLSWLSILLAVLFIYIFPFYLKDPSILMKGINYHNVAVLGEWQGYAAVPRVSYTFDNGVNFALYYYHFFPGSLEHRIWLARVLQAASLLLLLFAGLIAYRKWKERICFYDLSLVMLYLFLLFFFMFGPLTYQYYYLPLLMISAIICAKAILFERKTAEQTPA